MTFKALFTTLIILLTTHAVFADGDSDSDLTPISPEGQALRAEITSDGTVADANTYVLMLTYAVPDTAPLTKDEELAVGYYTGNGFGAMDRYLESGKPSRPVSVKLLDQALKKLPPYVGAVYHMQYFSPENLSRLTVGLVLHYTGYVSTSKTPIEFPGNVRFIIHQKTGRDIQKYSLIQSEQEVLIGHGAKFQITSAPQRRDNELTEIELTEL